jgi:hypothetical protein
MSLFINMFGVFVSSPQSNTSNQGTEETVEEVEEEEEEASNKEETMLLWDVLLVVKMKMMRKRKWLRKYIPPNILKTL